MDLEFELAMIGSISEVERRGERCDCLIGLAAAQRDSTFGEHDPELVGRGQLLAVGHSVFPIGAGFGEAKCCAGMVTESDIRLGQVSEETTDELRSMLP